SSLPLSPLCLPLDSDQPTNTWSLGSRWNSLRQMPCRRAAAQQPEVRSLRVPLAERISSSREAQSRGNRPCSLVSRVRPLRWLEAALAGPLPLSFPQVSSLRVWLPSSRPELAFLARES